MQDLLPFSHKSIREVGHCIRPGLQIELEFIPNVFDLMVFDGSLRSVQAIQVFSTPNLTKHFCLDLTLCIIGKLSSQKQESVSPKLLQQSMNHRIVYSEIVML